MKKQPHALLLIALASLTFNAHALCVNPDGSLDNAEYPSSAAWTEMVAVCEDPAAMAATETGSIKAKQLAPAHIGAKEMTYDRSALAKGDCSPDGGESRPGASQAAVAVCSL